MQTMHNSRIRGFEEPRRTRRATRKVGGWWIAINLAGDCLNVSAYLKAIGLGQLRAGRRGGGKGGETHLGNGNSSEHLMWNS